MNLNQLSTVDPEPGVGRPCSRGLGFGVKVGWKIIGSGMTDADVLIEFPYLEAADLRAAQIYAARLTDHTVLRSA